MTYPKHPPAVKILYRVLEGELGYFDPETSTIVLDPRQSRRQLRETVLHEVAHWLCQDEGYDGLMDPDTHKRVEDFGSSAASLLNLLRPLNPLKSVS